MKRLLLTALLLPTLLLNAQQIEQDCLGAIPICDSIYIQQNSYFGSGNVLNEIGPGTCLGAGELNAVWYKLITTSAGDLGFNIIPDTNTYPDYDWAVFDLTNAACNVLETNPEPFLVSCNFSGGTFPFAVTGANGGSNPQDEPMIVVLPNQLYYICVTNFSNFQHSYSIDFSISTCGLDSCLTQVTVGVEEVEATIKATLFPNPTSQNITLSLTGLKPTEGYTLAIYNSAGALVKEETLQQIQATLNVSNLPSGLYTYRIVTTNGKSAAGRFVKE